MKTKLFIIATLLISTIAFSQTSRKGYDYYKSKSDAKMNKGELIDAMAKDANISKRAARTGRNPQTGKEIKIASKTKSRHNWMNNPSRARNSKQEFEQTRNLHLRKRPGRTQGDPISGMDITVKQSKIGGQTHGQHNRGSAQDHNASRSNTTSSKADSNSNGNNNSNTKVIRKWLGRTKARGYNSSRSNKSEDS